MYRLRLPHLPQDDLRIPKSRPILVLPNPLPDLLVLASPRLFRGVTYWSITVDFIMNILIWCVDSVSPITMTPSIASSVAMTTMVWSMEAGTNSRSRIVLVTIVIRPPSPRPRTVPTRLFDFPSQTHDYVFQMDVLFLRQPLYEPSCCLLVLQDPQQRLDFIRIMRLRRMWSIEPGVLGRLQIEGLSRGFALVFGV